MLIEHGFTKRSYLCIQSINFDDYLLNARHYILCNTQNMPSRSIIHSEETTMPSEVKSMVFIATCK